MGLHGRSGGLRTWPSALHRPNVALRRSASVPWPTPCANSRGERALAGSAKKLATPASRLLVSRMGLPSRSIWPRILCSSCTAWRKPHQTLTCCAMRQHRLRDCCMCLCKAGFHVSFWHFKVVRDRSGQQMPCVGAAHNSKGICLSNCQSSEMQWQGFCLKRQMARHQRNQRLRRHKCMAQRERRDAQRHAVQVQQVRTQG